MIQSVEVLALNIVVVANFSSPGAGIIISQSKSPHPLRNSTNTNSIQLFSGSPVHREKPIFSRCLQRGRGIMANQDGSKLKVSGVGRKQSKQISQPRKLNGVIDSIKPSQ